MNSVFLLLFLLLLLIFWLKVLFYYISKIVAVLKWSFRLKMLDTKEMADSTSSLAIEIMQNLSSKFFF